MKQEKQELPEHLEAILERHMEEFRRSCDRAAWRLRQEQREEQEALGRMGLSQTSVAWLTLGLSGLVFLSVAVACFCLWHS